ncbi:2-keto-4-pentenoate hydratase [Sphingomonas sp.]|uniref:2-keto-4-pentenoate hydratase n=1 Tax=Sphingomonas sp. TaxID=28214 RepID=UPI003B3A9B4A
MTTAASKEFRTIAERFVAARRSATSPIDYPGTMPSTLEDAYAIQDLAISAYGDEVVGWKVGRIGEADLGNFDTDRLAGPIFARHVVVEPAASPAMPIFAQGFAAAEAEFLLRIGKGVDPDKTTYTMEEAAALVEAVHVGIEIASSPFAGINQHGPTVTVSDFGNNNGLIVGPNIPNWRASGFERWPVSVRIEGVEVGRATTETMLDGAVGAVRFLLELLARRKIAVQRGLWVSTGAVSGVHEVRPGQQVEARFGDMFAVTCTIEATSTAW